MVFYHSKWSSIWFLLLKKWTRKKSSHENLHKNHPTQTIFEVYSMEIIMIRKFYRWTDSRQTWIGWQFHIHGHVTRPCKPAQSEAHEILARPNLKPTIISSLHVGFPVSTSASRTAQRCSDDLKRRPPPRRRETLSRSLSSSLSFCSLSVYLLLTFVYA